MTQCQILAGNLVNTKTSTDVPVNIYFTVLFVMFTTQHLTLFLDLLVLIGTFKLVYTDVLYMPVYTLYFIVNLFVSLTVLVLICYVLSSLRAACSLHVHTHTWPTEQNPHSDSD